MKKIFTLILSTLVFTGIKAQGDCYSDATSISTCGYFFAGNNSGYSDNCPGAMCGCVGGSSNPRNLDNNCSTTYAGGNCGSDFLGSIENSMFWYFRPSESCDYELCITPANCCCNQGAGQPFMQVWIGQRDTATLAITQYYVNDNANTSITSGNTICYTFSVNQADGDLVIMVDGNAGTECDINLDISQVTCTDTCPVVVLDPIMKLVDEPKVKTITVQDTKEKKEPKNIYTLFGKEIRIEDMVPGNIYIFHYGNYKVERVIYTL